MPNIHPAAGDAVQVSINVPNGKLTTMLATVCAKANDGRYEIELTGEPTFRATVDMRQYEWSQEHRRWLRKPATKAGGPHELPPPAPPRRTGSNTLVVDTPTSNL